MRPSELQGKKVVGTRAKIIGTILDIEFDPSKWKVMNLHVELTDEAIETLSYKKPRFGRVDILLSVKAVKAVADIVSLRKSLEELKDFITPQEPNDT